MNVSLLKTVYPRLAEPISADELVLDFTPTQEEIEFSTRNARQPASRLTLLVLLKLFGYFCPTPRKGLIAR